MQIDQSYATVGKNRDISLGLAGDPGTILAAVANRLPPAVSIKMRVAKRREWMHRNCVRIEKTKLEKLMPVFQDRFGNPIHPYRLAYEINRVSRRRHNLHRRRRRRRYHLGPGGAPAPTRNSGWTRAPLDRLAWEPALPWQPSLPIPEKEVMCLYGDGSFGMTAFDMETAQRFGAPYLAVVGNNSAMNQLRYGQIAKYGQNRGDIGNKLGDVASSASSAKMIGGYGEEVRESARDPARPCAARAKRSPEPANARWSMSGSTRMNTHRAPKHRPCTNRRMQEKESPAR